MVNENRVCFDCKGDFIGDKKRKYCDKCNTMKSRKAGYDSSIKRMIRNREFIRNYKQGKECEICGYNRYPQLLDFHHKDRKLKSVGVNILMKTLKNLDIIQNEIEKCMLVCPNCHRELHLKEGFHEF